MIETTDTNSKYADKNIPDGKHNFSVDSVEGKPLGGAYGYVWKFNVLGKIYEHVIFPNEMGSLLDVLGFKQNAGIYQWDTDKVQGKEFGATVSHLPDKKGVVRQKMSEFKSLEKTDDLPF
jgi:hypothetical protein